MGSSSSTTSRSIWLLSFLLLLLLQLADQRGASAFSVVTPIGMRPTTTTSVRLFSATPPQRQPRRKMPKRRRRNPRENTSSYSSSTTSTSSTSDFPWETAESRPLVSANAREAGEDYWIDMEELQRQQEKEAATRKRRAEQPGQMSDEKLWTEVLRPYKQNWIGYISVTIIVISFIIKNFPEVINLPVISDIPDIL
jgi:hypothetical protein